MRVSNPFRYKFRSEYPNNSAVYKIWVDSKFMIWKGKNLHHSAAHLSKDIDQRLRNGTRDKDYMQRLIEEIISTRVLWVEIEMVFESEDPSLLLKFEHDLLQQEKDNPLCLNSVWEVYTPKWIPEHDVEKFKKLIQVNK